MKVVVIRHKVTDDYSLGNCLIVEEDGNIPFIKKSLERGWRDNQQNVSCIPTGEYKLRYEYSPRFKKNLWEIYGVPNRRECKFHAANYWSQLNGCIALGTAHTDINKDGDLDVTSSRNTMTTFHDVLSAHTSDELKLVVI